MINTPKKVKTVKENVKGTRFSERKSKKAGKSNIHTNTYVNKNFYFKT